jgi:hypothetical protein
MDTLSASYRPGFCAKLLRYGGFMEVRCESLINTISDGLEAAVEVISSDSSGPFPRRETGPMTPPIIPLSYYEVSGGARAVIHQSNLTSAW